MTEIKRGEIPDLFRAELETTGRIVVARYVVEGTGHVIAQAFGSSEDMLLDNMSSVGRFIQYYPDRGDVYYDLITKSHGWFGKRTFRKKELGSNSSGGFERALEALR